MQCFECQIREMRWMLLYKTCEEKCLAWGKNVFLFLPLYSLHHCMNGGLPWRHRGPFPYWLTRWSQSDEESRDQMLPGLILLSPVSSVSTFTFVGLCSSPLRLISPAVWFLVFLDTVTTCNSDWFQNTVSLLAAKGVTIHYKTGLN